MQLRRQADALAPLCVAMLVWRLANALILWTCQPPACALLAVSSSVPCQDQPVADILDFCLWRVLHA
jgi:hypothetical protein